MTFVLAAEDAVVRLCMQSSDAFFFPSITEIFAPSRLLPVLPKVQLNPCSPSAALTRLHAVHGYYSCARTNTDMHALHKVTHEGTWVYTRNHPWKRRPLPCDHDQLSSADLILLLLLGLRSWSKETDEAGWGSEMKTKSDRTRATAMGAGPIGGLP